MTRILRGVMSPLLLLTGFRFRGRVLCFWFDLMYSVLVIVLQVIVLILWAIPNRRWGSTDAWWIKLFGSIYNNGNPTNIANPINDIQLDIKTVSGRLTLYQTTLCEKLSWDDFNANVDVDPEVFMSSYNVNDIQVLLSS